MKKICFVMLSVLLSGFMMMSQALALDMKEGKWEMTVMVMEADGNENLSAQIAEAMKQIENLPPEYRAMVESQMKAQNIHIDEKGVTTTQNRCLKQDNLIPEILQIEECEVSQDIRGNTLFFKASCRHEEEYQNAEGEMTYNTDTMEGKIRNYSLLNGQISNDTAVTITGRYIGECDQEIVE